MQIKKSAQSYNKICIYASFFCTFQKKVVILQREMLDNPITNSKKFKKV